MKHLRLAPCALLAGAAASLAGCYVQRPLTTASPQPNTRIVAQVTESGAAGLRSEIGADAREVEGVVTSADTSGWTLNLTRVTDRGGRAVSWNRERVSFPAGSLSHVAEKRVDRTRSIAAAGIVVAAAFFATRAFNLVGAEDPIDPGPVPPNILIPFGVGR